MSYKKRDRFDDPTYMDQGLPPALAYDNYAMYENSVISGQSLWGKFHHSSRASYRLKGSDSGSFGSSSGPSRRCRRCAIVTAVLLCLGVLGAVVGVAVYFSDKSPMMKTTAMPPTTTTPGVPATFSGSVKLQQSFTPELSNPSSTEYKNLASSMEQELDSTFRRSGMAAIYNYSSVTGMSPGSIVVQFRSFFIHNTLSVVDSNGNTQPKQIDMTAVTQVIVDEIKAKKQSGNTNSPLSQADETSLLLAEGEVLPTTTAATTTTTIETTTVRITTTQETSTTTTTQPTTQEPSTTTTSQPATQAPSTATTTQPATQAPSTTTTTQQTTQEETTTAVQEKETSTKAQTTEPTTSKPTTEMKTEEPRTTTTTPQPTTTGQGVSGTEPSMKATTPMTTIPITTIPKTTPAAATTTIEMMTSTTTEHLTTTVQLPTTTEEPAPPVFVGEVKLNQTWDESLNNTNSTEYQTLATNIEAELDATFKNSSLGENYNYSKVTGFKPGSIEVDYISYFIETTLLVTDERGNTTKFEMNASVVVQVFREEVKKKQEAPPDQSGSQKSFFSSIITESIKVVQLPPPRKPTTGAPTKPPTTAIPTTPIPEIHPCDNYTLIEALGIQCAVPLMAKLISPKDQMEFCQTTKDLIKCVNDKVNNETHTRCSPKQIDTILADFGPRLKNSLSLPFDPYQCLEMTTQTPHLTTMSPSPAYHCNNFTYIELVAEQCIPSLTYRFQNAKDLKEFCTVTKDMVECVNRVAYNEKGSGCSEGQVERLLQYFGPVMQRDMGLPYNPADCVEMGNKTTETTQLTTIAPPHAYHCDNFTYMGSVGEQCIHTLTTRFQTAQDLREFCTVTKDMVECVNRVAYNEKGSGCSEAQVERLLQYFGPVMQRDMALPYNPADCLKLENETTGEDVKFSLKFLDLEWNDALLNENSDYYVMMERIVMENMTVQFMNLSGIRNLKITGFRNGSLVVDFRLSVAAPRDVVTWRNEISEMLSKNGSINLLTADPSYFQYYADIYNICGNVTYVKETIGAKCNSAFYAFINGVYDDNCRTYRDLILCTTTNIQIEGYPCSLGDIEMLVGKNIPDIFGEMKFSFDSLQCADEIANAPKLDMNNLCRHPELYNYHLKYSCIVNRTDYINYSDKEICSLYNYKVFCTQYSNRGLLQFGNCDPSYSDDIIESNRSTLLPELDAMLNNSICKGQSSCEKSLYSDQAIVEKCSLASLTIAKTIPISSCLAIETIYDCIVATSKRKNPTCSENDIIESSRLFLKFWGESYFYTLDIERLTTETLSSCTPTKPLSDPDFNYNSTCQRPNMILLLGAYCFESYRHISVSNDCLLMKISLVPCIQGAIKSFLNESCTDYQVMMAFKQNNETVSQIFNRDFRPCLDETIRPTNETCLSLSTFETSEYSECFGTYYILTFLNMTSHHEKCRFYEHSLRCVETSLPYCQAGDVHLLINYYLESANLMNTSYDNKCEVSQSTDTFCEDDEAVFLQVYGRCVQYLFFIQYFCTTATEFMECAYNATEHGYFSCSKPSVNKILLNATSFYERKFPGQSQTISTCLSKHSRYEPCEDTEYIQKMAEDCFKTFFTNLTTASDNVFFCRVIHNFTMCTMNSLTKETGVRCTSDQISRAMNVLGPRLRAELNVMYHPEACFNASERSMVKRAAFSIRLTSLNWTEDLSDHRSPMFKMWNHTIVSNFTAVFGHYPGFLGLNVTDFRRGSVYADMEFKYDSSLISITDARDAVQNATRMGLIYRLPVDNYFMFRGDLKDGMCPVPDRNSSAICIEECQMDSNCSGTQKCCFNGCGRTCQEAVYAKMNPCDDMEYLEKKGEECLKLYHMNLTTATDSRSFCRVIHNFTMCTLNSLTKETGERCTSDQISRAMKVFGPGIREELNVTYHPETCFNSLGESIVKRAAFSIRLTSLNWTEDLSDHRSPMFKMWNHTIVSNFTAVFGHYPGFLGLNVTDFRRGSVYADMEFKYDSSLISITDARDAVQNATRMGLIYRLPVDNYFMFRGDLKDGMCPVPDRNSSAICIEECQMDSNCSGTQKCCFNGCGRTCQEAVYAKMNPCDDMEYLEKKGEECLKLYHMNLTTATDSRSFCRVIHNFTMCTLNSLTKETGERCTSDQISRAMKVFGPGIREELNVTYHPETCFNSLGESIVKRAAFSIRLTSLNWTEDLSDHRSPMFKMWNHTIVSNFTAVFGHYPGFLGLNVTDFRRGSVYADMEFKYDSSLISITDARDAVQNATRMGLIYRLPVDNYFMFRGDLKDGMCPVPDRNSSAICIEECQMDSNCSGTQKCCFNGCGRTCQEAVYAKMNPCDDMEYLEKKGEECLKLYHMNLTTATDSRSFCRVIHNFTMCTLNSLTKETGERCTSDQISRAMKVFGPGIREELNVTYHPETCFNSLGESIVKRAAFSIRLTSLNWTEDLSDHRSPMFKMWNHTIVSNFTAVFGHYPGFLGLNVTDFRRGSVYADMEFKYDSSLISITDARDAVQNATRMGLIYRLPVDNYFMFRGDLKDGMCPVPDRNSSAICIEECQMDSNCSGTQKCCFNGCGRTCQEAVYAKMNPCDDMEYLEKKGEECLKLYHMNLTTATDSRSFCRVIHNFTMCTLNSLTKETGERCTSDQISRAMKVFGPGIREELNVTYHPETCFNSLGESIVKRAAFSIRLTSLNWTEDLSDHRSPMFKMWNHTIVSNFTAVFGHYPGFLGLNVTDFRRGSVYADMEFKYDSSLISITDARDAVQNATRMGLIYRLPVDNYFMFRGDLKDGMCPVPDRNSSAICIEECQMDSNCSGTQKCCFNGCGRTCQEAVYAKMNPCDDMEYLEKKGEECLKLYHMNLTTATDSHSFCRVIHNFTMCTLNSLTKETGVRCTSDQISRAMKVFGPGIREELNVTYHPETCFNSSGESIVKRAAFSIRLTSLNWTEDLSDHRSPMFKMWNHTIVSNFTAVFGHYPGFLGLNVTDFRRGSVYADMEFKYDSSLISITDARDAVQNATRMGLIYRLPVDNYFMFRGDLKDGMCPVPDRNSSAICIEECQMDSNCSGTQKCCFNGCGRTCQEAVYAKMNPCDDMEYLEKKGEECLKLYHMNLTTATDSRSFCRVIHNFTMCTLNSLTKETGERCTSDQISRAMKVFGPGIREELNVTYHPETCFNSLGESIVKRAAFSIRLTSLNWTEDLSDHRSPMFKMWNHTIVSNFTAVFGHYPGFLGLNVTDFRRGSVYADMEFKYDSSLISITDARDAVQNATRMGLIYRLPVDNYFMFRGDLKDGMCPVPDRNSSAICIEECQMDSNCSGTQKCCFNGCGRTCQEAVYAKMNPCDDMEYLEKKGEECLKLYHMNLTTATDSRSFCRVIHNFTMCTLNSLTKETGERCTSDQISRAMKVFGPGIREELNVTYHPETCFNSLGESIVKRAAFSIRLTSLNWTEDLSDHRSPMFKMWNHTIVSNFTAVFGHYPGFLGLNVTDFRRGSVYADMEFKYDSSLISITDARDAVQNATRMGLIYRLPVDNYFMFRGDLKDGMCPVPDRNSSAICIEECQMDSNCSGTQKCCFNGCGRTCQEAVYAKMNPCDDMEYLEKKGEECLKLYHMNLTTATDSHSFCRVIHNFTMCTLNSLTKETGVRCTSDQISRAMKVFGPGIREELNVTYHPETCFNSSGESIVKRAAFSIRLTSLNWTEDLSDHRSPMFKMWNHTIVSNFTAVFGHYPGFLGLNVTDFRRGSVYADMEFKYDSSLISITDARDAVQNATRMGLIYRLPVDNYFMFRGDLKDGMCPVPDRNSSAICIEECQMDSNCSGTQKCCFNGCGRTCQEAVYAKMNPCDDMEYLEKKGEECLKLYHMNLTTATDSHSFCRVIHNFTMCTLDSLTKETGVRCTSDQISRAMKVFGPGIKEELNVTYHPETCFNSSGDNIVKRAAFSIRLTSLNWTEDLSDHRSPMFKMWNHTIVSNFTAVFGHYPGFLGLNVTDFRRGSVYADMEFKYDSSLISITDARDAVQNATRMGLIYRLPVDNYFMFRGDLKDGMCPVPDRNSSAICIEESLCQMDSNCLGTQKCCFNGCGRTCRGSDSEEITTTPTL